MKTKIIIALLLITSLLCACTSESNKKYTIFYEDGKCYIKFSDDIFEEKETESNTGSNYALIYPHFDSVAEMKEAILSGDLDDSQLYPIRRTAKQNNTAEIYDPNKFQIPLLPNDFTLNRAKWYGNSYSVGFAGNSAVVTSGSISCMGEEKYRSLFENRSSIVTENQIVITDTVISERNARVIHRRNTNAELRDEIYTLPGANGYTLYVFETYVLQMFIDYSTPTSESVPKFFALFGTNGENYFYASFYEPEERPSVEWLSSFGLVPLEANPAS